MAEAKTKVPFDIVLARTGTRDRLIRQLDSNMWRTRLDHLYRTIERRIPSDVLSVDGGFCNEKGEKRSFDTAMYVGWTIQTKEKE